jgi:penicillin-binding protein 2
MRWKEYLSAFGLGHRLGVDLPSEDGGNIPDTSAYDKDYHRSWNSCTMVTIGIGQDKMQETPLQICNSMCVVANKGYFYTPHFVKDIEGGPEDDSLLSRFHERHAAVSHITNDAYDVVQGGMQGVTEIGTGKVARIPGINMCAKTGTAENKLLVDGKVIRLKTHSLFACFAPRENPRIAVVVVVENGGYGKDAAAPIASLLVEKYLNDTIATNRLEIEDRMTNQNNMPGYLVRRQFKADSLRAVDWARQSGDSTRWLKYQTPSFRVMMMDTSYGSKSPLYLNLHRAPPYKSALAERQAKLRAQAAAATIGLDSVVKASASGDSGTKHVPVRLPRKNDTGATPRPQVHQPPPPDSSIHKDSTK